MDMQRKIPVNNSLDIVMVRMQAWDAAKEMGFCVVNRARISLAASELARVLCSNHNGPHELIMSNAHQNGHEGLQVTCLIDRGSLQSRRDKTQAIEAYSIASRSLDSACHLLDESLVKEQNKDQALVTLIKWLT